MEGKKVRIGDIDYKCIGNSCGNWVFAPINRGEDESVIFSETDILELKKNNDFNIIEEV